ncbi:MAG: glycine cleavage system aminomethyltransferase GcvT [Pseudomonadota bacterium]
MADQPTPGSGTPLKTTALHGVHTEQGARLVPFAGYEMPLQYEGIVAEHKATRASAGLFDVSHMGQIDVTGEGAADWLERLTPADVQGLSVGGARYTAFTLPSGGLVDDLIITRLPDRFRLVVNGARREAVAAHLAAHPAGDTEATFLNRALIAIQGPAAEAALQPHVAADLSTLIFMRAVETDAFGAPALVSRSGYTGEDGFELSLTEQVAPKAWKTLTADERVSPVGLGARDTLRLEAGLPLYGQDLDETINPIEAGLGFIVSKRRRADGGFLGDDVILAALNSGPARRRVGLKGLSRVPVRAGAPLFKGDGTAECRPDTA